MIDCPNAEIRDRLPEWIAGVLDASAASVVRSHVESCAACRDEVALIRSLRDLIDRATPAVDVAAIAARIHALPIPVVVPTVATPGDQRRPTRSWDWRIAAAIAVITAGGASVGLLRGGTDQAILSDTTIASAVFDVVVGTTGTAPVTAAVATSTAPTTTAARPREEIELSTTAEIETLTDTQLDALLKEIDKIEALPLAEPPHVGSPSGAIGPVVPDSVIRTTRPGVG